MSFLDQSNGDGGNTSQSTGNVLDGTSLERGDSGNGGLSSGGGLWGSSGNWSNSRLLLTLVALNGGGGGSPLGGVGGWDDTLTSNGQSLSLRHGDGDWSTLLQGTGLDDNLGGVWAVSGVVGNGYVSGDDGIVGVGSNGRTGQESSSSDSGVHYYERVNKSSTGDDRKKTFLGIRSPFYITTEPLSVMLTYSMP